MRVDGARDAGLLFERAVAERDFAKACDLPAPETRAAVEQDEKQSCAKALETHELPASDAVDGVEVSAWAST
ncbi:hypothetical protein [Streptomyces virginiae]|uniref:hypothetical protein n=1 Tax=Streptomyces virginiae TaxID=1961 RepID=UPI003419D369